MRKKYAHVKKQTHALKFDILCREYRRSGLAFENTICELKVRLEDGKVLFVHYDDFDGDHYALSNESAFDLRNTNTLLEEFGSFYETAQSMFYDLYYALERYKDRKEPFV